MSGGDVATTRVYLGTSGVEVALFLTGGNELISDADHTSDTTTCGILKLFTPPLTGLRVHRHISAISLDHHPGW